MKRDVKIFLLDIEDCIEKIELYTKNLNKELFLKDLKTQDAVIQRVEIIGEAGKNIPEKFREKHPEIPWSKMAKTRYKLIHGYFGVNFNRVWTVVKYDLPDLKKKIKKILDELEKDN